MNCACGEIDDLTNAEPDTVEHFIDGCVYHSRSICASKIRGACTARHDKGDANWHNVETLPRGIEDTLDRAIARGWRKAAR